MKLPVKLLMSLISLVSVIARAGEYKNYSRDEIKYWRYTSYKWGKLPEGFTDEKFSSAIYNGRIFTMKRLHTLMLFLAVLFTGFNFKEGANKRGNSSRLTQSFHFFMFEPIFSPVNALNQPI